MFSKALSEWENKQVKNIRRKDNIINQLKTKYNAKLIKPHDMWVEGKDKNNKFVSGKLNDLVFTEAQVCSINNWYEDNPKIGDIIAIVEENFNDFATILLFTINKIGTHEYRSYNIYLCELINTILIATKI